MRVAVVMPRGCLMERGQTNSMETVAQTLNARSRFGDDVRIICDAGATTPAMPGLLTIPAKLSKSERYKVIIALLRDLAPDIVEYHQQLGPAAELARGLPGPMHVLYRHTRIKPPSNPIERFRYRRRLEAFDHLLFVSEAACAEFRTDYPRFKGSLSAVCNPIDIDAWRGRVATREPLILFSGRALPEKGLDTFCQALATVLDQHPTWRGALMLGEWERNQVWAEPHVRALERFGDRVELHKSASVAKVIEVSRRAAIAVTPSRVAEALGLTALEAHAAGAALVSSGRGGLREASGDHALYVDPPEAPGLAEAISRLVTDDKLRRAMAAKGQAHVVAVHNPVVRAKQLDDLRQRLADEGRARSGLRRSRLRMIGKSSGAPGFDRGLPWADAPF